MYKCGNQCYNDMPITQYILYSWQNNLCLNEHLKPLLLRFFQFMYKFTNQYFSPILPGTLEIVASENGYKDKDPVDDLSDFSPRGEDPGAEKELGEHQSDTSGDVTDNDADTKGLVSGELHLSDKRKIFLICLICFPQFIGAVQFSMIGSFYPQTVSGFLVVH